MESMREERRWRRWNVVTRMIGNIGRGADDATQRWENEREARDNRAPIDCPEQSRILRIAASVC